MNVTETEVSQYILDQLGKLAEDWDHSEGVTPKSLLFTELGFESLDAVVLAVSIQDHYDRQMPFAELFAELGEQRRDLSVQELIDFTITHLAAMPALSKGAMAE
jgi:acyl carrier protein